MKLVNIIFAILLSGCEVKQDNEVVLTPLENDSVLINSQKIHEQSNIILKATDENTAQKVNEILEKNSQLEERNKTLIQNVDALYDENTSLKGANKYKSSIIIRDTIYIIDTTKNK